jgi:predicted branched-subunit amino acid permease
MILGLIGLGIIAGTTAGSTAFLAGYSVLMSLWLYTLAGWLAVLAGALFAHTAEPCFATGKSAGRSLPGNLPPFG